MINLSNYTQYDGSNSQTAMAQRLLDNGSDWLTVRVGQYDYLFVQGKLDQQGSVISYNGESWIYRTSTNPGTLTYMESDSGTVRIKYPNYVYSSEPAYQSLSVIDVYPKYAFYGILALILVFVGFQCIKRRFVL